MTNTSNTILAALSERGYRLTKARREICSALLNARKPLSIRELVSRTKSDEASVYRCIHTLKSEDLIEEITVRNGKPRYAISSDHHHHVVCTDCGRIAHVPCSTPHAAPRITGFTSIDDHDMTFYGQCTSCA